MAYNGRLSHLLSMMIKKTCNEGYVGETADNAHHRGRQHADRLGKKSDGSVLWKHVRGKHATADPPPVFSMKVTEVFTSDALLRQVEEGNIINKVSGECMNSEWNYKSILRIDCFYGERG